MSDVVVCLSCRGEGWMWASEQPYACGTCNGTGRIPHIPGHCALCNGVLHWPQPDEFGHDDGGQCTSCFAGYSRKVRPVMYATDAQGIWYHGANGNYESTGLIPWAQVKAL